MSVNARLAWVPILFSFGFLSNTHSLAQQTDPPQSIPYKIESNVDRVLVPVVVRDKQGHVVSDLKQEDFQVFDNDKPRSVSAFQVEKHDGAESLPSAEKARSDTGVAPSAQASGQAQRFVVFLFDDMHLSNEDLAHVQKAGAKVLAEALTETDIAAVISTSGKTNSGLTRDRARLQEAIKDLRPHSVYRNDSAECPKIDYYQADQIENKHDEPALQDAVRQVYNCSPGLNPKYDSGVAERTADSAAMRVLNMGRQDVLATYVAIGGYVGAMAALPGQRMMILVSPGFLSFEPEALTVESRLMDMAARANVTISALDARGLYTTELSASERSPGFTTAGGAGGSLQLQGDYRRNGMTQAENVMAELADGTGGNFFHNSNDLYAGFKSLTVLPECVYMLELPVGDVKPNGSLHRLRVKVDREGVQLQARRGYFVPKPGKPKK